MASSHPVISMFSNSCTNLLVSVTRVPFIIGMIVTCLFHISGTYVFFLLSFNFTLWSAGATKSTIRKGLSFLLNITRSGRLVKVRWYVCIQIPGAFLCIIIYSLEFFTSGLSDGLSLEFEWQQVLKSAGLFSVFWTLSIMLYFGWSPLICQLPSPPVPLIIL